MPIKRPHKKSRLGCEQCRKRRVKCDEQLPRCANCIHRDDECCFPSQRFAEPIDLPKFHDADSRQVMDAKDATSNLSTLSTIRLSSVDEPIGLSDIALMHHWCTQTCHSFSPKGVQLFREHVGQEALQHGYVMEALLAITSLHLASEAQDAVSCGPLVQAALRHQNRSLVGLREALGDISPSTCDAVFSCALLIMVCGIVSPLLPLGVDDDASPATETVLRVVDFMNGISCIMRLSRQWIVQGPLATILSVFEPSPASLYDRWSPAEELRLLMLKSLDLGSYKLPILDDAIQGLERVFRREHCAIVWVLRVDVQFIEELRQDEPLAKMIFIHWGVLLYLLDDMWWKKYSGLRLVEELSATLREEPEGWGTTDEERNRIIRWCRQQVGLSA